MGWSRPSCRPAMASSRRSTSEMRCSGLSCQPKTASAEHREGGGDSFFFFMRRLHQQVDRRLIGSVTRGDTFICQVDQAHPQPRVPVQGEQITRTPPAPLSVVKAKLQGGDSFIKPRKRTRGSEAHQERELPYHHPSSSTHHVWWGVFKNYVFLDPVRGYVGNLQVQGRPRGSTSSPTKIKKEKESYCGWCTKGKYKVYRCK